MTQTCRKQQKYYGRSKRTGTSESHDTHVTRVYRILATVYAEDYVQQDDSYTGLAMINQCTKLEVSRFTHYKAINGSANAENGVVWSGGALEVMSNVTIG